MARKIHLSVQVLRYNPCLDSPRFNRAMDAASKLSGDERYAAYAQLDRDLMRDAAPWATYANPNARELV